VHKNGIYRLPKLRQTITANPNVRNTLLAEFVSEYHQTLTSNEIDMLVGVGSLLVRQAAKDWRNDLLGQSEEADTFGPLSVSPTYVVPAVTLSGPRELATVRQLQTLLMFRQQLYDPCAGLTFIAPRLIKPGVDGCNWELQPVPERDIAPDPKHAECLSLMKSYILELQAAFNLHDQTDFPIANHST
jgi:hypothetical protein